VPAALASLALGFAGCDEEIGPGDDRMPSVVGKSAREANAILDRRGFTPSYGTSVPVDDRDCRVVEQRSPPGARVEPFSVQRLRCVVRVPRVVGDSAADAELRLQRRGLDVVFRGRPLGKGPDECRVVSQDRRVEASPQADIRLRLRC